LNKSSPIFIFVLFASVGMCVACGGREPIVGSSSVQPSSPTVVPNSASVTGIVFENTGHERRPVPGARVFVVDLEEGPYGLYPWFQLVTDAKGEYQIGSYQGRAVKVTAYAGDGFGLWNQSGLAQRCAAHPIIDGRTTADIELTSPGIQPANWQSPILSGGVLETVSAVRRPAEDMPVLFSSRGHDGADVYTRTDLGGRYAFCGLPPGAGYVLPACTRATTPPSGYRPSTVSVDIRGDTVLNIECP
jgi:hypothetical protein